MKRTAIISVDDDRVEYISVLHMDYDLMRNYGTETIWEPDAQTTYDLKLLTDLAQAIRKGGAAYDPFELQEAAVRVRALVGLNGEDS